jgi:hypothetical protein
LARFAETVTVLQHPTPVVKGKTAYDNKMLAPNIHLVKPRRMDALPIDGQRVDLVYIVSSNWMEAIRKRAGLKAELKRVMAPSGLIYTELDGITGRLFTSRIVDNLAHEFGEQCLFWVTPQCGDINTAVPAWDETTMRYFTGQSLVSPSVNIPAIKRLKNRLIRKKDGTRSPKEAITDAQKSPSTPTRVAGRLLVDILQSIETFLLKQKLGRRFVILVGNDSSQPLVKPPHYVRTIAHQAGLNLDTYHWGVLASGRYASRKITFFLFPPHQPEHPTYVFKMVRHPDLNFRLENEERALNRLMKTDFGKNHIIPKVVSSGSHQDLALIGETAIIGLPFRQRSAMSADCLLVQAAVE